MSRQGGEHAEWLALCRRAVDGQRQIFAEYAGIAERTEYEGVGEGGDRALRIDRLCEDAVFSELDALHAQGADFTAISEERGEVEFGSSAERIVIDPIDGSLNARRTIPSHSFSLAVASGDTMAQVHFGYVYDFGAQDEFVAADDRATLNDEPLGVARGPGLEIVGLEAAKPERVLPAAERLSGRVYRLRAVGSIAISLAYVAAGRFDGMLGLRPCRSVDVAAAQLIARAAGATVSFGKRPLDGARLELSERYPIAAARSAEDLPLLLDAQLATAA